MPVTDREMKRLRPDPLRGIIYRWNWWTGMVVPLAAFAFVWWLGWGVYVAIGAAAAASIIVAVVRPRGSGRWTE